jgi:hypothetical protein
MYKLKYFGNLDPAYKEPPLYWEILQWIEILNQTGHFLFNVYDIPQSRKLELIECMFDYIKEEYLVAKYGEHISEILDYSRLEYEMNEQICRDITVINRFGFFIVFRLYDNSHKQER